ncbi:MAG: response regulator, partial [Rhodocyclaceae bacterium]|nr:response regulator [Rhodocyclaceae bacterium]
GLEPPEQRRAMGKPDTGTIRLSARYSGAEVVITLGDDGRGLDLDRIRARAEERGLIEAGAEMDEASLRALILRPGFSTAASVTELSGRGVGMDVVKSETAAVGGRIDIESQRGRGASFRIYLPVNLAVTQALLVRAGHRTFAIPSTMVAQVRELKADALEELRRERRIEWMGQSFEYRYLPRLVGDAETQPEVQRFNWVLLLRAGAQTLCLHVDSLRGNQEVVVKNAGPHIARIVGISGATVMGDGEIVLILNPVALAARPDVLSDEVAAAGPRQVAHIPTVMVVDDSLTVRKITGRLLEREGYRVVTAKDGVDALERLLDTVPDVILSDIEMPRMDGFDLARNIRADQRLKALPIIMITSRLADKHKEYAREIGVQHYLGKPYDEAELLGLIASYAPLHPTPVH